jgi:hypothetical protein
MNTIRPTTKTAPLPIRMRRWARGELQRLEEGRFLAWLLIEVMYPCLTR